MNNINDTERPTDRHDTRPMSPHEVAVISTIAKPRNELGREVFNIRAIDLILKFKGHVDMVLSPEWKEAASDLYNMVGQEEQGYIMSDFFVVNAKLMNSISTKWTCERTF